MNKIMRKLRSRKGVSMLIALVFLLFTSFVGGSVLVAATSNAYRVAHLKDQQDYLTERSTALLIADELHLEESELLKLTVTDTIKSKYKVVYVDGGGWEKATDASGAELPPVEVKRYVAFQITTNLDELTQLQKLMIETTVCRYLQANPTDTTVVKNGTEVELQGFDWAENRAQFMYQWTEGNEEIRGELQISGTAQIQGSGTISILDSFTAYFTSGTGTQIYDFIVDFGDVSQLMLTMNAFSGTSNPLELKESPDTATMTRIYDNMAQTVISWDDPFIEKGGAR